MRVARRIGLTSCLMLALGWLAFQPPAGAVVVERVLDGDTVLLADGRRVRYLGVNTPEHGQLFAEEAKRTNERLVQGKDVRLVVAGDRRDGYQRTLALVYVGKVLANARLIANGVGYLFVLQPLDHYPEWLELQRRARALRLGMWGAAGQPVPLRITTVRADAAGSDRKNLNGEYVRVCNVDTVAVELKGYTVGDASGRRFTFPAGRLEPGYTALLLSGRGRTRTRGLQFVYHWGSSRPIWNNTGDTASLFDPTGALIDTFHVRPRTRSRWRRLSPHS